MKRPRREKLIPEKLATFVNTVSELAYCNPYTKARLDLERRALGRDYKELSRAWNTGPEELDRDPNLELLKKRVAEAADELRQNLQEGAKPTKEENRHYLDLVYFHLYHVFENDIGGIVERAHRRGGSVERIPFYDRFLTTARHYFEAGKDALAMDFTYAHIFACFYQVRRAFHHTFAYMVGSSQPVAKLKARVWQSIFTHDMRLYQQSLFGRMGDIITLITGPSGTGKELVAQAIGMSRFIPFDESGRQFVADFVSGFHPLNLAALSPTLIESELFGHRKGAFTGALQDHKGYLENCGLWGTVFLDEIGETDPAIQVKLLRLLQTRCFQRLGDTAALRFEGKLMAATNRDLVKEMERGRFREDFFYRLCADQVQTHPLREILAADPNELSSLIRFIAVKVIGEEHADKLTEQVTKYIDAHLGLSYAWPGNFRELEQCVRNILVHGDYAPPLLQSGNQPPLQRKLDACSLTMQEMASLYVTTAHARSRSLEETARRLGIDRRTVKKHLDEALLAKLTGRA